MAKISLPKDGNNVTSQLVPAKTAIAVTTNSSLSSAVNVTLQTTTTFIEVNALSQGIYMRYAATASSSNFDEYIQAGSTRHYFIPPSVTVVSFIEESASAKLKLIEK